jgi:chromosomal replication initiator protein
MRTFQPFDNPFSTYLSEYSIDVPSSGTEDVRKERVKQAEEVKDPWTRVGPILRGMLNGPVFERWFAEARLVQEEDGAWVLLVPSYTHCLWIETNFLPELQSALAEVFDGAEAHSVKVREEALTDVESSDDLPSEQSEKAFPARELFESFSNGSSEPAELAKRLKTARLNPDYAFERFVVGSSNEFAHACCVAISKGLGKTYNPLFLHGDAGMGKTHLVQALGQAVMRNQPRSKVVYLTCERFTNEFIDAVQKGNLKRFRSNYRKADVFIVDDVQFLNGKEKTGDEFFHTFNALLDMKAHIILTSDRPACEIQTLEPRLVSRFESGLTVAMQPPSLEMRTAILQKKVAEWQADIPHEVISYIAEHVKSNVRRLEGALVRVATYSSLGRGKLSLTRVEELLKDILREEASRKVTIDSVQRMVADYYDLRISDMTGRRRPKAIAHARQVAMFLSRELTKNSLKEIGEAFGGRDHGTIIHAVNKVRALVDSEKEMRQTIDLLSSKLSR